MKTTTYPPIQLPGNMNSAEVARQYGLPADLYTNGLYLTQAFYDADLRLSNAVKQRLPQARINSARSALEFEWKRIIDDIREEQTRQG